MYRKDSIAWDGIQFAVAKRCSSLPSHGRVKKYLKTEYNTATHKILVDELHHAIFRYDLHQDIDDHAKCSRKNGVGQWEGRTYPSEEQWFYPKGLRG
jgi:hypothetical protein